MSDAWKTGIEFSDLTDVGMRRANNQDAYASLPADSEQRYRQRGHLFVVADGMGAHAAGELASRMAIDRIAMHYFRSTSLDAAEALRTAVQDANAEIHRRGQQNPEFHNMGTTASTLALLPQGALIAHVGDSRVYRLRSGIFEQLTFDHSLVWEMQASGQVHPDSTLSQSIPKNVITRSLGPSPDVPVDLEGPHRIRAGDVFLLCSDGLTGQVDDAEVGVLVDCLPTEKAARVLVDLANLRGGPDNTTVIVVRVNADLSVSDGAVSLARAAPPPAVPRLLLATVGACALGAIALGIAGSWGTAIVAIILTLIAAAVCWNQYRQNRPTEASGPRPQSSGGRGPYRRYKVTATAELHQRLADTVDALRKAAAEKDWTLDWREIDRLQRDASQSLKQQRPKEAVRYEAEAIVETMNQLREQHSRAAGETAVDL